MIALLGRVCIYAALGLGAAGTVLTLFGDNLPARVRLARRFGLAFAIAFIVATAVMIVALLAHDFSVSYVAHVGSLSTPTHITLVSLWSSLEGSILFWACVLAVYALAFLRSQRHRADDPRTTLSLGVILAVGTFFALLIAAVANPFLDTPHPIPADGNGPNPLLQNHPLMIIHPPMLYLGYVGMTIPFAMGVAALASGRADADWMRAIRRWMLVPWAFLGAGIVLGGWWAYEVLGWGGWWGWDPVENASLLPWLVATAFLHVSMLEERRGLFKGWTFTLLLVSFALTVLGTFMTRSGVFNSVHSFTQSPIGPTFLAFLGIVVLGSIALLALRLPTLTPGRPLRSPLSREAALIVQNLFFVAFTFAVLLGTTYPLVAEAVRGVKVSVGGPFFEDFALPLGIAILFLMGIGPAMPWGAATPREALRALALPAATGVSAVAVALFAGLTHAGALVALSAVGFAATVAVRALLQPVVARRRAGGGIGSALRAFASQGRRRIGAHLVHLGIATVAVAIALSSAEQTMTEALVHPRESLTVGGYRLELAGTRVVPEPHRRRQIADFVVYVGDDKIGVLSPAMNHYAAAMNPIGTPAVRTTPGHDLYLSIMHIEGDEVGVRAFINPAMVWLWIGAGVMTCGAGLLAWPRRRRPPAVVSSHDEEVAA